MRFSFFQSFGERHGKGIAFMFRLKTRAPSQTSQLRSIFLGRNLELSPSLRDGSGSVQKEMGTYRAHQKRAARILVSLKVKNAVLEGEGPPSQNSQKAATHAEEICWRGELNHHRDSAQFASRITTGEGCQHEKRMET